MGELGRFTVRGELERFQSSLPRRIREIMETKEDFLEERSRRFRKENWGKRKDGFRQSYRSYFHD
ncbi:hypothetical protein Bca101_020583 [Brassica carinata]